MNVRESPLASEMYDSGCVIALNSSPMAAILAIGTASAKRSVRSRLTIMPRNTMKPTTMGAISNMATSA